jgi:hypothetical protein
LLPVITCAIQIPRRYHRSNWPTKLRLQYILADARHGFSLVTRTDGSSVEPLVPFDQLAHFLNSHVDGAVETLGLSNDLDPKWEEILPQLLNDVRPEHFLFESISLKGFFRHLSWPAVKRIFGSEQMMRVKDFRFDCLQLPRGVGPRAFLMELGAVRECEQLIVYPVESGRAVANMPRFSNADLLEWLRLKEGKVLQNEIEVKLFDENLAEGVQSLVHALMKVGHITGWRPSFHD